MFKNRNILITGGTGSFGKAFIKFLLKKKILFKKIVIFSRDEFKQNDFWKELKRENYKNLKSLRFILGDVRDKERLQIALGDIDFVVHAAALKQVPAAEYNPIEFVKTNIIGAQNIVESCYNNNIKKVIALSTDKAVSPINLYGATKLCSDKLFVSANNIIGKKNVSFSVVRYGNVDGSRGSVIPLFLELNRKNLSLPVTDLKMTRFSISMQEAIKLVFFALKNSIGGEIFIPKIYSYDLESLVKAIKPSKGFHVTGKRVGEKTHEELISIEESGDAFEIPNYYILFGKNNFSRKSKKFYKKMKKFKLKKLFSYNSLNNKKLSIKQLENIIKTI